MQAVALNNNRNKKGLHVDYALNNLFQSLISYMVKKGV